MGKQSGSSDGNSHFQRIVKAWPGNDSSQQRQRLLQTIQERGSVTTMEAVRFLEIVDPRPRIFELRAAGWQIVRGWTMQESETGGLHRVGSYRLRGSESCPIITALDAALPSQVRQPSLFDSWP